MAKQFFFNKEAQDKIRKGVNLVADAAGKTLGAKGKLVAIAPGYNLPPITTKDGVTVVRNSIIEDETVNVGGLMVRYAAERTLAACGDGTTTSAVLAQAMINAGLDAVNAGRNAQQIKSGMEKTVNAVVAEIEKMAIKQIDNKTIKSVATISANNDSEVGNLIAEAYAKIGQDGILTIERSKDYKTHVDVVSGSELLAGWAHDKFINNRKDMTVEYENPNIAVFDYEIKTVKQMEKFLMEVNKSFPLNEKPLIIVAKSFEGEFYNTAVVNKVEHGAKICLIQAPFERQSDFLVDFAAVTGASLIADANGKKVEHASLTDCGRCSKIIIRKNSTTVIGGMAIKEEIDEVKEQVTHEMNATDDDATKDYLQNRLGRMSGNIGVIYVGGVTDVEQKERYDRVDDAVKAVKSAIEEGIVPGGGKALINAAKNINSDDLIGSDEVIGLQIILEACYAPLFRQFQNAELNADELMPMIKASQDYFGYNLKTNEFCNLIESNIIDPAKVVRCAIQNAASVAGQVINTEVLLVEIPVKE